MNLPKNMGTVDRIARAVFALVLIALTLTGVMQGVFATIAIVLAVVMLITSVLAFCPLYAPFHFSTRRR